MNHSSLKYLTQGLDRSFYTHNAQLSKEPISDGIIRKTSLLFRLNQNGKIFAQYRVAYLLSISIMVLYKYLAGADAESTLHFS